MDGYKETGMPLIGDRAPEFHAVTTQGELHFPQDFKGKWVILFSHPADFTPVCTTEFMTFGSMINDFAELNTQLVGLSIDSIYSHIAWLRRIKELAWKDLKHIEITFPLIADITMEIAKKYGMLQPAYSGTQTVRAVFVIDPVGIIRTILYYPATTGRNIEEIKRIVIALQKADEEKIATPANWMPGDDVILPAPGTCNAAAKRTDNVSEDVYCIDWFLCFKQSNGETSEPVQEPETNPYPSVYPPRRRNNNRRY